MYVSACAHSHGPYVTTCGAAAFGIPSWRRGSKAFLDLAGLFIRLAGVLIENSKRAFYFPHSEHINESANTIISVIDFLVSLYVHECARM